MICPKCNSRQLTRSQTTNEVVCRACGYGWRGWFPPPPDEKPAAIKSGNDATTADALHALVNQLRTIRKKLWALGVTDAADHVEDAIACIKQRLGEADSPPTDLIPEPAPIKFVTAAQLMWREAANAAKDEDEEEHGQCD